MSVAMIARAKRRRREQSGCRFTNSIAFFAACSPYSSRATPWTLCCRESGDMLRNIDSMKNVPWKRHPIRIILLCILLVSSKSWAAPIQQAYLKASTAGFTNLFGWAVAISEETVVVGALNEFSGATNSGAAYVFVRIGTNWHQ